MKLIAIETATGKQFPVREAGETWILVQTGKQSYVYEQVGEHYTLHISTGVTDKHGREILVGNRLRDRTGDEWKVTWDGKQWSIFWTMNPVLLTTELAREMEVVS